MLFPAIKFSIHNIAFSSEKVILFESGEKYAQNNQNSRKYFQTNMSVDFDLRGQQGMDFCHWRKCYCGLWTFRLVFDQKRWVIS